jgi:hypothetical protein
MPDLAIFLATSRFSHLTPGEFFGIAFWIGFTSASSSPNLGSTSRNHSRICCSNTLAFQLPFRSTAGTISETRFRHISTARNEQSRTFQLIQMLIDDGGHSASPPKSSVLISICTWTV